jgi:hypothetical protein
MTATSRPARVARMLLRSGLLGLASVMSACVLPIGPEFQDPPAAANFAPQILDSQPAIGSIVTVTGTATAAPPFRVSVSDPNVGDDLHVRFLADFPPKTGNTRTLIVDHVVTHNADGTRLNEDVTVTPSCGTFNLANIALHQIMVIVADRPFLDKPAAPGLPVDLTKLADPEGLEVVASWTLEMDCQASP